MKREKQIPTGENEHLTSLGFEIQEVIIIINYACDSSSVIKDLNSTAKSIASDQPAQTAQADLMRYFLILVVSMELIILMVQSFSRDNDFTDYELFDDMYNKVDYGNALKPLFPQHDSFLLCKKQ